MLCGLGGNDTLTGGEGDDVLYAGPGNDSLAGGGGADILDGDVGRDTVTYKSGATAGASVDLATGEVADDGTGSPDAVGRVENVTGTKFDDALTGDGLANVLTGGDGDDALAGAAGGDTLDGATGSDSLSGGADNDTVRPGADDDAEVSGGSGKDTLSYNTLTTGSGITLDLAEGTVSGAGSDTVDRFEKVVGTRFGDELTAAIDSAETALHGIGGDDEIDVADGAGGDTANGGAGADSCQGDGGDKAVSC